MIGSHKLVGQYGGRFHFAQVDVEIIDFKSTSKPEVILDLVSPSEIDVVYEDWKNSAILGVERFLTKFPVEVRGKVFKIKNILATLVDTEDTTIEVTAYLATYSAVYGDDSLPKINFKNSWEVED